MIKIFIDSDIVLDLLLDREPHSEYAALLFEMIENKKIHAATSGHAFSNIFYILNDLSKRKDSKRVLLNLRKFIDVAATSKDVVDKALVSEIKDFEDAMQYYCALSFKATCIVTRNKKDYKKSLIPVLTAKEFLSSSSVQR